MTKDKTSITGHYGFEKGEIEWSFKIFKNDAIEIWHGYYLKDEKKMDIVFNYFTCPLEGGIITGNTTDGKKAKGYI